jgi:tetratricopeptide (TPR) repeat protein
MERLEMTEGDGIVIDLHQFFLDVDIPEKNLQFSLDFSGNGARKFHLSVIAFVALQMKRAKKITAIPVKEHKGVLSGLDERVSLRYKSQNWENLRGKLIKSWKDRLRNLQRDGLFKVLDRDWTKDPGTKRYSYDIQFDEDRYWKELFYVSGSGEQASLKLAIDKIGLKLDDVSILFKGKSDEGAWESFLDSLPEVEDDLQVTKVYVAEQSGPTSELEGPLSAPLLLQKFVHHGYASEANFTGRETERKMLSEWFESGEEAMMVIHAIGGMGKSFLAWYWWNKDVSNSPWRPEGVIWWSFYEKDSGFEFLVDKCLRDVTEGKVESQRIMCRGERIDRLCHVLSERRFLLVLDGVERLLRYYARLDAPYITDPSRDIDEDQGFRSFFEPQCGKFMQNLADKNMKSKTLVTSRQLPFDLEQLEGCRHKELMGLTLEDAYKFFHSQGLPWTRPEVELVSKPYEFLPLSLRVLTRVIAKDPLEPGESYPDPKRIMPKLTREGKPDRRQVIELAYDSFTSGQQDLLSRMSAFRFSVDREAIFLVSPDRGQDVVRDALEAIMDMELLKFYKKEDEIRYDMHPVVRAYSYGRLAEKKGIHGMLAEYFRENLPGEMPRPEDIRSLSELTPLVELYHHTVRSEGEDKALELFKAHLFNPLYYQLGAYGLCFEMLASIFDDDRDSSPRLRKESDQAWVYDVLALNYARIGQPRRAVPLFYRAIELVENSSERDVIDALGDLARTQMVLGDLENAEKSLLRRIRLCRKSKNKSREIMISRRDLGRLNAYLGKGKQAEKELSLCTSYFKKNNNREWLGLSEAYRSLVSKIRDDYDRALEAANIARHLANVKGKERDIIWCEFLLGSAYRGRLQLSLAEKHTNEGLKRCRWINLVEIEADILLELARIRNLQKRRDEAYKCAQDASMVANRCEYRLQQADINLFLAEMAFEEGNRDRALQRVEIAIERASCGYKPTLGKAKRLKKAVSRMNKAVG